ncbi:unnamed protein product [Mytilus coruscus]|uniref:Uncharacterized protein n=1 Tax=Mytilus coruscus TaxID=42192 RepID=A0A6J8EWS6_MYTCO|nr:unnamed protein product [Mytilus coruscus]
MKCDECGVTTKNIWRHMINTHNKNYTKRENDAVTSGGYITYICPAPKKGAPSRKCGKVEKRLTDHLARSHKIKRGSKRMKTMLARADAVIKETVVEPEKTILISESEEEIVMQPEIKTSKKPDLFYRNNAIRNFCDYLAETGISKADAIQCKNRHSSSGREWIQIRLFVDC